MSTSLYPITQHEGKEEELDILKTKYKMKGNELLHLKQKFIDIIGLPFKHMDSNLEGILDACVCVR